MQLFRLKKISGVLVGFFIMISAFIFVAPNASAATCSAETKTIYYLNYILRYRLIATPYTISADCSAKIDTDKGVKTYTSNDGLAFSTSSFAAKQSTISLAVKAPTGDEEGTVNATLTEDSATTKIVVYKKYPDLTVALGKDVVLNGSATSTDSTETKTSCSIAGIGWLLCPVFTALSYVADASYGFISKQFLEVSPGLFITSENSDQKDAAKALNNAWSIFRNVANIGLVIAFILIIISQLTGFGISNYGIKKMLPRLVMVIILINLSYFLVQGAIDISNILGSSIYDGFKGLASQVGNGIDIQPKSSWSTITENVLGGSVVAGAAAVALWGAVGALLPVLLAAVVGILMIFFILVLRQVVIILLIVLAPLAFLAYLLPNTEKLFTQWRKTLTAVLIIYPICSLVFGASAFASELLKLVYK